MGYPYRDSYERVWGGRNECDSLWPDWKDRVDRYYWENHLRIDLKERRPRSVPQEGAIGIVKGVKVLEERGERPRDLQLYIPTKPETEWAREHLPRNYSNDPKYPISKDEFERTWEREHTKPGSVHQMGDQLELAFGMHRLRASDPLDITDGLLCYAAGYDGTYHSRKIGPYFHRTCVTPRVRLPENAGPEEWTHEHLRVAYGLGLAASEHPQDLHPWYLYHAYAPMAGKAMNRVPDDHDQTRTYTVTEDQRRLLAVLKQQDARSAACAEAVYFVLECSALLKPKSFKYKNAEKQLAQWPVFFKNGLLPQRQVALFKHLAKKCRPSPFEECMRVCELLYGKEDRLYRPFKEDRDLVALIGEGDIDDRIDWIERVGTGIDGKYKAAPEFSERLQHGTALEADRAKWLATCIIGYAKHAARAERVLQAAIEMFADLEGEALNKAIRSFQDYFLYFDRTDQLIATLEVPDDTPFVFPGIGQTDKGQEPSTALTVGGHAFLTRQTYDERWGWGRRALTVAPGDGVAAKPSTGVFDLYQQLHWAGYLGGGSQRLPIETLYFTHLAPHLPDPLHPPRKALDLLKDVYLLDMPSRAVKVDVCIAPPRWTEDVFGYAYSYEEDAKIRQQLRDRAYQALGQVMDFMRLGVLTEAEATGLMADILDQPWRPQERLSEWEYQTARSTVRSHYNSQPLTDSYVDSTVIGELKDRLVLAKLHKFECLFPAFNNLMILALRGLIPMEKVGGIILAAMAEVKKSFVPRPCMERFHKDEAFKRTKDLTTEDYTSLAGLTLDWDVVLTGWENLPETLKTITEWGGRLHYAEERLDVDEMRKAYANVPHGLIVGDGTERIRAVEIKRWRRNFDRSLGEANFDWARALYAEKPDEVVLEPIEDIINQTIEEHWHVGFMNKLGYADFRGAVAHYDTKPKHVELTDLETEIYRFLEWIETNYAWVRETSRGNEFQNLLQQVVHRIRRGEKVTYGELQRKICGSDESATLMVEAIGAITDETNRRLLAGLLLPKEGTGLRSYAAIREAAATLDDSELEVYLKQVGQASVGTGLVPMKQPTAAVNQVRFRRAAPDSGGHEALSRVNGALWSASQTALDATQVDWGNTALVMNGIAELRELIRTARIRSFLLPPLGSKIHFGEDLDRAITTRLLSIAGLSDSGFRTDGNRALLLPAVPSGDELEHLVRALVTVGRFTAAKPKLQLCMGTRLPKLDTAILGSTVILASGENRPYHENHFRTSHEGHTAGRIMVYDDGGTLSPLPFARRQALQSKGRTDMLARYAARDPWHFQLVGGVLADGIIGNEPFSEFAAPWKARYREILGDHGLSAVLDDTWVFDRGKDTDSPEARERHFANVMACINAYADNLRRFTETGLTEGVVFDVRAHIDELEAQIRPIQDEMLQSNTYCNERRQLLEF